MSDYKKPMSAEARELSVWIQNEPELQDKLHGYSCFGNQPRAVAAMLALVQSSAAAYCARFCDSRVQVRSIFDPENETEVVQDLLELYSTRLVEAKLADEPIKASDGSVLPVDLDLLAGLYPSIASLLQYEDLIQVARDEFDDNPLVRIDDNARAYALDKDPNSGWVQAWLFIDTNR